MANFCKECTHWECVIKDSRTAKGVCTATAVASNVSLDGESFINTAGVLWTSPHFGCIYWEEDYGSLLDFDDIIDEQGKPKDDE